MSSDCKALILDFGGVISRTLFETHHLTEHALGLAAGSLTWRGPFAPETDREWRAMQAEEISERDYWHIRTQEVAKMVGKNWSQMSDFVQAARGADPEKIIRPEFFETIAAAKSAGKRLAILSNELDLFYGEKFRDLLPFLADFEVIHDATYTKTLKPDPRAYGNILLELGLKPNECVFVGDQLRNIDGAKTAGMKTVHFDVQNPAESYAIARQFLGI
ncbi:MAG: HAD-IA family hydrolase [Rhodobacterales bacterium]|nr:HAD-IA family hydrolase [Rhodobacterales bacterium]